MKSNTVVIIPAFNEENAVGKVVEAIPKEWVQEVVVVNNNSTDLTSEKAQKAGATVLFEAQKGYGKACLKGIDYVNQMAEKPEIIVFIDADYSDYPEQMPELIQPIMNGEVDFVIGSRALGKRESGSMTIPQVFGNWLATTLLKLIYGAKFTDLGPFRAIRYNRLVEIEMQDENYGWTVEMQIKIAKAKLPYIEVPVDYRNRIGFSKISGTVSGTFKAGYKIIATLFKYF